MIPVSIAQLLSSRWWDNLAFDEEDEDRFWRWLAGEEVHPDAPEHYRTLLHALRVAVLAAGEGMDEEYRRPPWEREWYDDGFLARDRLESVLEAAARIVVGVCGLGQGNSGRAAGMRQGMEP